MRGEDRRPVGEVLAQALRRDREDDHVGAGRDLLGVGRRGHRGRQLDAGEVVGVLAARVDRLDDLLASGPQHDVVAGVGEHQREGRAPRSGTEDSDLGHRLRFLLGPRACRWGCRSRVRRLARGSNRCGGISPRRSATSSVIAAMIRSVAWAMTPGRVRLRRQVAEVHRVAGLHRDVLARAQVRLLRVGRQDLLRTPLPDRDHRAPRVQRDPRRTGLALHRPQVGIAGEGALGVDDDALAGAHRADRCVEGPGSVAAQPLDRDLAGGMEEATQRLVGEEPDFAR